MNLYKIEFLHASPKDVEYGMKCLLLAENNEQVYEWIKSSPNIDGNQLFNSWTSNELDEHTYTLLDDDYNEIGTETFKEKIIRLNGQMNDDSYDFSDAYYGITLFGWSLLIENSEADYSELIDLGIVLIA
jgi:hypothetical protein